MSGGTKTWTSGKVPSGTRDQSPGRVAVSRRPRPPGCSRASQASGGGKKWTFVPLAHSWKEDLMEVTIAGDQGKRCCLAKANSSVSASAKVLHGREQERQTPRESQSCTGWTA